MIPHRTFRRSIGFRPGYRERRGFWGGNNGSIRSQRVSLTSGLAMVAPHQKKVSIALTSCARAKPKHFVHFFRRSKPILKGTRWLLLKNPENLDPKKNEAERLQEALELNKDLATVYYMKEDLRQIWKQKDKRTARRVLKDWLKRARASKIRMLTNFANTLEEHQEGILNYYTYRISTGPLEGTNTKIQAMKRQAYGFRDIAFYKLKILGIHETKHALVG
jgi:transposase